VVEEEPGGVGEGLGEGKEEEDECFTMLGVFEACNTHPSECGLPGRADPHLKFSVSVKKSYLILNMLFYKSHRSKCV